MDTGTTVLVAVCGDLLNEQLHELAALPEGFRTCVLYFRKVVCEPAKQCLGLLGSKAILFASAISDSTEAISSLRLSTRPSRSRTWVVNHSATISPVA